ncbi:MAG TPA: phosphoglucosamine mutase [Planctomycetota bacterium]|nr:phosphoglucosamine mutase [Planctomycetota bacterium]
MTSANMNDLMISISGVRGIVGRSLTPGLLVRLGEAFGTYMRSGKVVVGRDTRVSGEMVKCAVFSGLLSTGCSIVDVGVVATPTATLMIEELKADGGVVISASHNPVEWNALKFFRSDGVYLNADEGRDLLNLYYSGDFLRKPWDALKTIEVVSDAEAHHVDKVLSILDVPLIRSRKFRVALDCCNGAGVGVSLRLLRALGCSVEPIHCTPDGLFPHTPEPNFINLQDLCRFTRERNADLGFATDPDADRIAVVSEKGDFLGEELSLALATQYVLSRTKDRSRPVVINMSTSRVTEDIARQAGCQVIRTAVGEVNVAERMEEANAIIGGEGNGGVIDPRIHYGRDAIVGMGLILELMARTGSSCSQLAGALPQYAMLKTKIDCPAAQSREVIRRLKAEAQSARANLEDGLRLDWDDRWVHLRASNTEPVMRIIAEARTPEAAQALVAEYTGHVQAALKK